MAVPGWLSDDQHTLNQLRALVREIEVREIIGGELAEAVMPAM